MARVLAMQAIPAGKACLWPVLSELADAQKVTLVITGQVNTERPL